MDGGDRSTVDVYTCEIGQLRATVQAPVSGNGARVAGGGGWPARWSVSLEMTTAWSAGPHPLISPTTAPGAWPGPSLARD